MGESFILPALQRKRAYLQGEIEAKDCQLGCLRHDLETVDRMIRLLDAGTDPSTIKGTRPLRRMPDFKQGDLTRLCYTVLREAGQPLSARQAAEAIATKRGIEVNPHLVMRVRATMGRLTRTGKLHKEGIRRSLKWQLPP